MLIELRRLKDPAVGLKAAIEQSVANADGTLEPRAFAHKLMCQDRLLMLVDGLDEIADKESLAEVSRWLEEAIERYLPQSTFVVTSRYAGLPAARPTASSSKFVAAPAESVLLIETKNRSI